MDPRLKHIVDHYDTFKIGPDEPFPFHCVQCGKCCVHREDILLNPQDLFRMAKHLGQTPKDVVIHYCEVYTGPDSFGAPAAGGGEPSLPLFGAKQVPHPRGQTNSVRHVSHRQGTAGGSGNRQRRAARHRLPVRPARMR